VHAQTTIAHLPAVRLTELPLGVPPIERQRSLSGWLSDRFAHADRVRVHAEAQLDAIDKLPATLLRQAFNAEL